LEAKAITEEVILKISNENPKIIKIHSIGKYPYISLNTHDLKFGELLIGKQQM